MRAFPRLISTELLAVAGLGLAAGIILGVGAASAFYISRASSLTAELANKTVRVRVLESLITADASSFGASSLLSTDPAPSVLAAVQGGAGEQVVATPAATGNLPVQALSVQRPAPTAREVTRPVAPSAAPSPPPPSPPPPAPAPAPAPAQRPAPPNTARPAPQPASVPAAVAPQTTAAPVATTTATVAASGQAPGPSNRPSLPQTQPQPAPAPAPAAQSVAPQEIAASIARNPVVGVSSDRLGVARVEPGGVRMRSGTFIAVGQRFSNGERLLQVDPENNRIVTSDRQLLVFFSEAPR